MEIVRFWLLRLQSAGGNCCNRCKWARLVGIVLHVLQSLQITSVQQLQRLQQGNDKERVSVGNGKGGNSNYCPAL